MTTSPAPAAQATVTVIPNDEGTPIIRWDLTLDTADEIMTLLAREALADPNYAHRDLLDSLYRAVSEAADFTSRRSHGCADLWPDAAPMPLTEGAVLGSDTGDMLAVLLPGEPGYLDAVTVAVQIAREGGADLDPTDETLVADVHPARWMVLNTCESTTHDFHPELAAHGSRTPGAVLVTRVDLTHV